ncbi:hypothetical protein D9M70_554860 [compost metagenome]
MVQIARSLGQVVGVVVGRGTRRHPVKLRLLSIAEGIGVRVGLVELLDLRGRQRRAAARQHPGLVADVPDVALGVAAHARIYVGVVAGHRRGQGRLQRGQTGEHALEVAGLQTGQLGLLGGGEVLL